MLNSFLKMSDIKLLKILIIITFIFSLTGCYYTSVTVKGSLKDYTSNLDIRDGDFIFQHLSGRLTRVIADVTNSQYSHCGIVEQKPQCLYVLEAIGPVIETPLNLWIARGVGQRITIVRLKEAYQSKIPQIIKAAKQFMYLPYDIQYEWDDSKIYCSELIYKAAERGANLKLANFVRLGDLNWQPHQEFIRYITGGELPLEREMITPDDLVRSDKVDIIYSSFPLKITEGLAYKIEDLEGSWSGDYTFPRNQLIQATIAFDSNGHIKKGRLARNIFISSGRLKDHNPTTGEFAYIIYDTNGTGTTIYASMDPTKDAIYGKWKDSRGYSGVFSLIKQD